MSQDTTKYQYTDSDGDVHTFNHIERWCRCGGNCESDTLEYFDPCDGPGYPPYRINDINCGELKWFISELIDMAVESGRMKKVE